MENLDFMTVFYMSQISLMVSAVLYSAVPLYQEKAHYIGFFSYVGGVNTLHMLEEVLLI